MQALMLSWRFLRRDFRAGELRVLALATVIAVASITAVGFFTDRVNLALSRQATELLAGDLALVGDHRLPEIFSTEARRLGLSQARTASFPSMVITGERSQLAEVKAVSEGYPLRGTLRIAPDLFGPESVVGNVPAPGSVWVDARLAQLLDVRPGSRLTLGNRDFDVAAILAYEPDRSLDFFSIAPRLMLNEADLSGTGLIQTGSRVLYRLLLAGEEGRVDGYGEWARRQVGRGERVEGVRDARPEMRSALERAQRFLGLAALASGVLAAVAVGLASRRHMRRHLDGCAIMRCVGASQGQIFSLFMGQFILLGILAGLVGSLIGFAAQFFLSHVLQSLVAAELPLPSLLPLFQGLAAGLVLLLGFSLPPLLRLMNVPALRVLRRELDGHALGGVAYGTGFLALAALLYWQAGDARLGHYVLAGLLGAALASAGLAWLLIRLTAMLRGGAGVAWRFGLANLRRRAAGSVAQAAAFGLGLMMLLLLTLVRGDLMQSWQSALPADAPNRFIINIQSDQLKELRQFFAERRFPAPEIFPMVRGRLAAINGRPVQPGDYEDDRARRLAEREFNLSWAERMQGDNRLMAGRWWQPEDRGKVAWSVEEGIAKTLGIKLGDNLTYQIAGTEFTGRVTSLRKVNWDSFHVNFFVVAPPGVLEDRPVNHITSFHLPEKDGRLLDELVRRFPNFSVIDVAGIMSQVRAVMDKVASAVQFVFLFTVAAGVVVLYAAMISTLDERRREAAILRTLGASKGQVVRGHLAEFAGIGFVAGVVAAAGASGLAYALAGQVLQVPFTFNPWWWAVSVLAGVFVVTGAGALATRSASSLPPVAVLREG